MTNRLMRAIIKLFGSHKQKGSLIGGPKGLRRSRRGLANSLTRRTAFDWVTYASRNQSLRLLRRNRIHVDTKLYTQDGFSDLVHWQVIVTLCPKLIQASRIAPDSQAFHGPLSGPLMTRVASVDLPDHINGTIARLLIECAYGEPQLSLDRSNLDEFYQVASEYQIDYAIGLCLDYARTLLDVHNCIYLFYLSLEHGHQKLRRAAYAMIRSNFKLILHVNKDFHHLEAHHLRQLLMDNFLKLNEDEEIAWLAIVRWHSQRLMSQSELTELYNQMVAEPSQQEQIQVHWLAPQRLASAVGNSEPAPNPLMRMPLRLELNFYSPADPIESASRTRQATSRLTGDKSPLRAAADKLVSWGRARRTINEEQQLLALTKCLRFMRFKSVAALDVILETQFIQTCRQVTQLVQLMRLRYKLRHGFELSYQDKQLVSSEQLNKLRAQETNKRGRLKRKLNSLIGCGPMPIRNISSSTDIVEQHQQTSSKSASNDHLDHGAKARGRPVMDDDKVMLEQLGQQSLERARRPRVPTSVGLLIGGWQDGSVCKSIWAYDFVCDQWFKLNIKLPEPRAFHASCSSPKSGHIYIFGGTNGQTILNSVLRFNLASDAYIAPVKTVESRIEPASKTGTLERKLVYKFKQLKPMNERRCHLSGVFHSDGRLYALGGHNGTQRLKTAEWYDPNSNQWHPIAEMTIARADAAACSHENKIFIAGGQISDQFIQSSVEFYKSSDNTWTFATPMIIPRMSFCMASYKGHLLAIGGTNGLLGGGEDVSASVTRTVERYNHSTGSWSFCAPLLQKRCSFGAMRIENKLLVMGGHGGRRRLKTCESLRQGQLSGPSMNSLLALGRSIQSRLQQQQRLAVAEVDELGEVGRLESAAPVALKEAPSPGTSLTVRSNLLASNNFGLAGSNNINQTTFTPNEFISAASHGFGGGLPQLPLRSAMKWTRRSNLPERRSGFSIAVVHRLKKAKEFTYFGSDRGRAETLGDDNSGRLRRTRARPPRPSYIKQPGRWHKFKIIKRRKLVKHLKIALVVTLVILMM